MLHSILFAAKTLLFWGSPREFAPVNSGSNRPQFRVIAGVMPRVWRLGLSARNQGLQQVYERLG